MVNSFGAKRVLITGANGLIGNLVYSHLNSLPDLYIPFGMTRRREPSARVTKMPFTPIPDERLHLADLTDFEAVKRAIEGMHTVVHMAANPNGNAPWESILQNNIIGSYHVFEASRLAGVKRVVYASTNQVVFGYLKEEPYRQLFSTETGALDSADFPSIDHTQPLKPPNFYACSKVYGEALAYTYAHQHGLSCICLRIGWVTDDDQVPYPNAKIFWCSHRDIIQLVERCIQAPDDLKFDIFFGHSDNHPNLVDIQHARDVLGYQPQDRAEDRIKG